MNRIELFGLIIKEARKDAKFAQDTLAHKVAMDRAFLSKIEHGKSRASVETLFKLSEALGLPASEIISRVEIRLDEDS